ncbi:DUF1223 domain-containing protein [Microvirga sp. Mcv34]|uniref:DUF1223 domain-containing protein n=1 Tax=Microvirga sp. Mcv34 TaxID=2926016 RepID=UPI0021C7B8BC|nr:DUF1223 domain-containing protein [Microvirga sp. Mcv34]
MKSWLGLIPVIATLWAGSAMALPQPRAVLELFVSQGCPACRPANQLAAELIQDPSLIVLSLPVNYWDYLGWKDTLAVPLFTARQKGYASARNNRRVYTPQMVVNGLVSCVGSSRDEVMKSIEHAAAGRDSLPVPIAVREENGLIIVDIGPGAGEGGAWLLPVRKRSQVTVYRGENAGRTETYTNVVRGLYPLGAWSGSPVRFEMPLQAVQAKDADSYVVLLQREEGSRAGLVLGAVKGPGL